MTNLNPGRQKLKSAINPIQRNIVHDCMLPQTARQQFLSLPYDVTNALGVKQPLQPVYFRNVCEVDCHGNNTSSQTVTTCQHNFFGTPNVRLKPRHNRPR